MLIGVDCSGLAYAEKRPRNPTARSAVLGAYLNVQINAKDLDDKQWIEGILAKGKEIQEKTFAAEQDILLIVGHKMS